MKATDVYSYLYALFDDVTPQKTDCGRLCGGACCKESDAGSGMYLYPLEYKMYANKPSWAKIYKTDFTYGQGKKVYMLSCPDHCDRALRPLACRIFPLVPYVKKGERLRIIIDPRGASLCPLYKKGVSNEFSIAVTKAAKCLYAIKECREFLFAQSGLIDDFLSFQGWF